MLKVCGIVSKAMSWAYSNSEYRGFLLSQAPEFLKYTDLLQQPSLIKSQILDLGIIIKGSEANFSRWALNIVGKIILCIMYMFIFKIRVNFGDRACHEIL